MLWFAHLDEFSTEVRGGLRRRAPFCWLIQSRWTQRIQFSVCLLLYSVSFPPKKTALDQANVTGTAYPWGMALGVLAVAWVVAALRRPAAFFNAQFWAEDGSVFFAQAAAQGLKALSLPHAGYQHLLQRIVAQLTASLPLVWMPTLFVVATVVIWSGVVLALFSPRVGARWPMAMVVVLVLLPSDNELWFNLTNVQWTSALLIPLWLVAKDAKCWRVRGVEVAIALLVGLTGVFSIVAAPLFVVRALIRRTGAAGILAATWVLAGSLQWMTVQAEGSSPAVGLPVGQSFIITGKRVFGTLFLPTGVPENVTVYAGLAAGLAGVWWFVWRCWRTPALRPYGYGAVFAALVSVATLWRFQSNLDDLVPAANGERYFFVPKVMVLWGLIQIAAQSTRDRWVAVAALILALGVALPKFKLDPLIDNDWPHWAERIEAGEREWVPITPEGFRFIPPARSKDDS